MTEYKRIPIGVEDFKRLHDDEYYFVDKTLMIKELLDTRSSVNLVTRPRRFGKTLNMSMLQRFFEKTEESNAYLFEGLNISRAGEKYMAYQGQFPVIMLSLKGMKQASYDNAFYMFKYAIDSEFNRHREVLKSEALSPKQRRQFENIYNYTAEDKDYINSIQVLSECLSAAYGKNVIILIDEYDVPLENAYFNGFYEQMVTLIRSVFESALKTNSHLEFGVLTGCLRVSKESIFTGLNNPSVYSVINNDLSTCFGFTYDEVKKICEDYQLEDRLEELKEWYDGYKFGDTEIYNPWSILNYLRSCRSHEACPTRAYWINTSSNDIIHKLVTEGSYDTHQQLEELVNGGRILAPVHEDITYRNIDVNSDHIWSFLLFTGYLKPVSLKVENGMLYAEMVIPNLEVSTIYRRTIMDWFNEKVRSEGTDKLFNAIINADVETFENEVTEWLNDGISFYDNYESFYHGFLAGLLLKRKNYRIESNREQGKGRSDITICEFVRRTVAVVIEIKVAEDMDSLDKACDDALKQIETNKYDDTFKRQQYKKVLKYGVAFCSDKVCRVKLAKQD